MNIRDRLDRLYRLLSPSGDGTFADFQGAFFDADPGHQQVYQQAVARHHTESLRLLLRRDGELREAVGRWCITALPGSLLRLPLSRLIHVPNLPGHPTECRIVVRPERHEDGSEFLQLWLTERTAASDGGAEQR